MFGCSQKRSIISEGYDHTLFNNEMRIITELKSDSLLINVYNPENIYYKLKFNYKYTCDEDNGYTNNTVYKGNDEYTPIIVNIPNNLNCNKTVKIKLVDISGNIIYESPIMKSISSLQTKKSVESW